MMDPKLHLNQMCRTCYLLGDPLEHHPEGSTSQEAPPTPGPDLPPPPPPPNIIIPVHRDVEHGLGGRPPRRFIVRRLRQRRPAREELTGQQHRHRLLLVVVVGRRRKYGHRRCSSSSWLLLIRGGDFHVHAWRGLLRREVGNSGHGHGQLHLGSHVLTDGERVLKGCVGSRAGRTRSWICANVD